jgi:hypothetical protein
MDNFNKRDIKNNSGKNIANIPDLVTDKISVNKPAIRDNIPSVTNNVSSVKNSFISKNNVNNVFPIHSSVNTKSMMDSFKTLPTNSNSQVLFSDVLNAKRKAGEDLIRVSQENLAKKQKLKEQQLLDKMKAHKARDEAAQREREQKLAEEALKAKKVADALILHFEKQKEHDDMLKLHKQLETKLQIENQLTRTVRQREQESARVANRLHIANPMVVSEQPIILDQLMGRLAQNRVQVCD